MEKKIMGKRLVLVDTNVLISAYRKHSDAITILQALQDRIAISIITAMELFQGCEEKRIRQMSEQLKVFALINVNAVTMNRALNLIKSYRRYNLKIPMLLSPLPLLKTI